MRSLTWFICLLLLLTAGCESGSHSAWYSWRHSGGHGPQDEPMAGACPISQREFERTVAEAARHLDAVARGLEEYGTISASTAAIMLSPGDHFKFDLDLTPREIFAMRPVQGISAARTYEELVIRTAASIALLRAGKQDEAHAELAAALAGDNGTDTQGDNGTSEEPNAPSAPPLPETKPLEVSSAWSGPDPNALDVSLRDHIKRVFDDHITCKLFEWLSKPSDESLGANKQLYAALLTVSVRPGRRTYRGYVGEIDIRFEYAACGPDGVPYRGTRHPLAFAAFPAVDTQVLDLQTSTRKQFALAVLLEAAFPKLGGRVLSQYVKSLERDVATRTPVNTIVGYNSSGRHFGWRFSPRFTAQADPAAPEPGPANILQAQSFPALVLVVADVEDLSPQVRVQALGREPIEAEPRRVLPDGQRITGPYNHLSLFYCMRWLRAPAPGADRLPLGGSIHRFLHPRLDETQVAKWARHLDEARNCILRVMGDPRRAGTYSVQTLRKRLNMLEAASVGADTYAALPAPSNVALSAISPTRACVDANCVFVVTGGGFKQDKTRFLLGSAEATVSGVGSDGTSAVITLPKGGATGFADVTVYHADGGSARLEKAVEFVSDGNGQEKPPDD